MTTTEELIKLRQFQLHEMKFFTRKNPELNLGLPEILKSIEEQKDQPFTDEETVNLKELAKLNPNLTNTIEEYKQNKEVPPSGEVIHNGYKYIFKYRYNDGILIRSSSQYKVVSVKVKMTEGVFRRRNIKKFGRAINDNKYAGVTFGDPINLNLEDTGYFEQNKNARDKIDQYKRRITSNDIIKKDRKAYVPRHLRSGDDNNSLVAVGNNNTNENSVQKPTSNKYVHPGAKNRYSNRNQEVDPLSIKTLMVSNISTDIDETHLEELFGYYGKIRKIHIAKDRKTDVSRGFAFVEFYSRQDAEYALDGLNGHRLGYLIMSIKWANR